MRRCLLALVLCFALSAESPLWSQQAKSGEDVLTVDQAVALALENNRLVKNAALEVEKYDDRIGGTRTHYFPIFNVNVLEARTLQDVNLNFPAGMFGSFPGIGPFPPTPSKLTAPAQWGTFAFGGFDQPLTQLYRVRLGFHAQELARAEAREKLRAQKQATAAEVRSVYYEILRIQSAWDATAEEIRLYRELDRLTDAYLVEQVAMKSESLEVKTRLAKAEYQSVLLSNGLETQKESLNVLLGREVHTQYRVSEVPEASLYSRDIEVAERRALEQRPERREALLKAEQAEYDRRLKKAEYVPDLSLTARYVSSFNVLFNPNSVGVVGFYFSWEPFDWGRKKHELAEKSRTIEQAVNGVHESESRIVVDVDNCFRKVQEAEALLKVNLLSKEVAKEQLRVAANKYREQASLLREVLERQASLADATHQYQQSLLGFWATRAELERALGEQ